jgi:hypothetical protein
MLWLSLARPLCVWPRREGSIRCERGDGRILLTTYRGILKSNWGIKELRDVGIILCKDLRKSLDC